MDTGPADEPLRRFRDTGDPEALGALFDATAPALFRVALRLTPDPASAEDALQETFLDLFDAAREWDPGRPALPWLTGILRHRVERVRRRESRRPDARRLPAPPPPPDPPAAAAAAEERDRARRAMLELPEPYRSVALLRWQYGLEPSEIAEVRGEPPGTVWSLLSRAKEKLKETLTGTGALTVAFLPGTGLDAVRATVMRHAAAKTLTASVVGGGLLVSKKVFVVVAMLCIAVGTTLTALLPRGGFRGRVLDATTGMPVAGARVTLPGKVPEEAVTDEDGQFVLGGEGREHSVVVAEAEGLVGRSLQAPAGRTTDFLLDRGDEVAGRVLGSDGAPLARALISILPRTREAHRSYPATATDAEGRFRCGPVDRDNYHNCIVRAAGHGRLVRDFNPARDGPGVVDLGDLVLPPARRVEGAFLSGRGTPLACVELILKGPLDLERACRAEGMNERATTDAAGLFRFERVAPGRYELGNEWGKGIPRVTKELLVADGDLLGVDFRIEHTGWLRVNVVDGSATPVPGVTVYEEGEGLYVRTGDDGTAVLENLHPGRRVHLTVQGGAEFGAWKYVALRVPDPMLPDGSEATFVVARAAYIRGVVLDEDGKPIQGVHVSGRGPWGDMSRGDGTFRIAVPEGTTVDLVAQQGMTDPGLKARAKGVKAPVDGLVLRMKRIPATGSLTLRLLDVTGLPVAGANLQVYAGEVRSVRTDNEGRVALEGLFAEETPVFFGLEPLGPDGPWPLPGGAVLPAAVTVLPDGRTMDIRLLPGEEIRGTVVDAQGEPVEGAKVRGSIPGTWGSVVGTADERGRFRLMVPASANLLAVRAFGATPGGGGRVGFAKDVRPATKDLVLRLEEDQ